MIETLGIEKGRLKTVYIKVVIFISDTRSDETCVCVCVCIQQGGRASLMRGSMQEKDDI